MEQRKQKILLFHAPKEKKKFVSRTQYSPEEVDWIVFLARKHACGWAKMYNDLVLMGFPNRSPDTIRLKYYLVNNKMNTVAEMLLNNSNDPVILRILEELPTCVVHHVYNNNTIIQLVIIKDRHTIMEFLIKKHNLGHDELLLLACEMNARKCFRLLLDMFSAAQFHLDFQQKPLQTGTVLHKLARTDDEEMIDTFYMKFGGAQIMDALYVCDAAGKTPQDVMISDNGRMARMILAVTLESERLIKLQSI